MKLFNEILQRRNAMITVQVEAAVTLQEWGDAENPDKYLQAMQGISRVLLIVPNGEQLAEYIRGLGVRAVQ